MLQNLQAEALEGQETNIITDYILKVRTQNLHMWWTVFQPQKKIELHVLCPTLW